MAPEFVTLEEFREIAERALAGVAHPALSTDSAR